jgi:ADP-ribosylglycohydrolase
MTREATYLEPSIAAPRTIVPLALALATLLHSAEEAILLAANVGGDSDSVASIAGGIRLSAVAQELAALRH